MPICMGSDFRRRCRPALVAGLLLTLAAITPNRLNGQGATSATVLGTVTDSAGAVVPNATVQVKNVGTGKVQQVSTDAQGRYTVADLPVGNYEAQASAQGFQTTVRPGISLTVGAQAVVDFSLMVGQSQQTVTVDAQVSQVDTVSTAVASFVEQKQINDLPLNGRNFTDLVSLIPGVSSGSQIGNGGANLLYGTQNNFSVSGARSEGQAYLLDSTDIQGFWNHGSGSGVMGTTLGIEAIAEFSVLTNTYSAQFGGNGAVVNAVSKSGTNAFHGSAYEFLRNSALDARNFFDGASTPAFRQNQFGGSLGGPIKKDKLFFFVNDEELRKSLGQTVVALVPDANAHNGIVNGVNVGVNPLIAPLLALYPLPTTQLSPGVGSIAEVDSTTGNENYLLARVDYNDLYEGFAVRPLCAGLWQHHPAVSRFAPASTMAGGRLDRQPVRHDRVPPRDFADDGEHGALQLHPHPGNRRATNSESGIGAELLSGARSERRRECHRPEPARYQHLCAASGSAKQVSAVGRRDLDARGAQPAVWRGFQSRPEQLRATGMVGRLLYLPRAGRLPARDPRASFRGRSRDKRIPIATSGKSKWTAIFTMNGK